MAPLRDAADERWYPGKYTKRAIKRVSARYEEVKAARAAGNYQLPRKPLKAIANVAFKSQRPLARRADDTAASCGQLFFTIVGGTFSTPRAFWIAELDGNEVRTDVAMSSTPLWHADFELPVYDPSSDLRLLLYDGEGDLLKDGPRGRIILPLPMLFSGGHGDLKSSVLPGAGSAEVCKRLVLRVMPTGRQHSAAILARYDEAAPGVPGSGMVKTDRGTLELIVRLRLDAPASERFGLLAAYAMAEPPGDIRDDDDDDDLREMQTKLQPKLLKLHAIRLARCLRTPQLLVGKPCLAMPLVLYAACFHLHVAALPWLVFALATADGYLAHLRRHQLEERMIFYEEEVGEATMPRSPIGKLRILLGGLAKMQHALGRAATALERAHNLLNWADPPVTVCALLAASLLCAVCSLVLALVPLRVLAFVVGLAALAPVCLKQLGFTPPAASTTPAPAPADATVASGAVGAEGAPPLSVPRMLRNVLARVPDGRDVAHRHFVRKEQILEMEDVPLVETGSATESKPHGD